MAPWCGREYVVAVAPVPGFFDFPAPLAFAHRGGAAEVPENTWSAFAHAVSLGYHYVETDIRATRDRVAVALHDPTIDRVSGQRGVLSRMSWRQLQDIRLLERAEVPGSTSCLSSPVGPSCTGTSM